jgi:hypothetical protein
MITWDDVAKDPTVTQLRGRLHLQCRQLLLFTTLIYSSQYISGFELLYWQTITFRLCVLSDN